jgi:hypothetical protein
MDTSEINIVFFLLLVFSIETIGPLDTRYKLLLLYSLYCSVQSASKQLQWSLVSRDVELV